MPEYESANTREMVEYIHQLFPVIDEEDKWLRDELLDLLQETTYFYGGNLKFDQAHSLKKWKKQYNNRRLVCHKKLIEKGIESPFQEMYNRDTKHNPDKKKRGKKKKGGRRRI